MKPLELRVGQTWKCACFDGSEGVYLVTGWEPGLRTASVSVYGVALYDSDPSYQLDGTELLLDNALNMIESGPDASLRYARRWELVA